MLEARAKTVISRSATLYYARCVRQTEKARGFQTLASESPRHGCMSHRPFAPTLAIAARQGLAGISRKDDT